MERIIFHIDVNNAFVSWTAVDMLNKGSKVDIRDTYCVIGGDAQTRNGIVLAKSPLAKKVGVVTAETIYSARKKCKFLHVYPPNYKLYQQMSYKLFDLLSKYSPDIEIASIDECYLDYGKVKKLYGNELEFAYKLKDEIKDTLGFTVNIGIANNKLCAKMTSDFEKPNKVHTLYMNEIEEKMWPLPIGELFGIGKKTSVKLKALGINTIYDLAHYDSLKLSRYFKNQAAHMINWANGIDDSIVNSEPFIPKGIGHEFTLETDVSDIEELNNMTAKRLRKQKKYAKVICVILKDNFFKRYSHQKKLLNATNITSEIYDMSKKILKEFYKGEKIRLIGLRLDDLVETTKASMITKNINRKE